MSNTDRLLIIELNEFNKDLLKAAATELRLQNIARLFELNQVTLSIEDAYESDFLEPWSQWVGIHTGRPSTDHLIKHLGDIPDCKFPQIWEVLSAHDITSGVWGALNANRGSATKCQFFVPDPWTFSEESYPKSLNAFLDFPRYMATHRTNFRLSEAVPKVFSFLGAIISAPLTLWQALKWSPALVYGLIRDFRHEYVGYCFAEFLSVSAFLINWKKSSPQAGFVFLNMIAHVQHYHWKNIPLSENFRLKYCLRYIDAFLEMAFAAQDKDTKIIVLNGLAQKNSTAEPPWVSYRIKDFESFLKYLGIEFTSIQSLMSYDAQVYFKSQIHLEQAKRILASGQIFGRPLFLVETYPSDPLKLFFRPQFYDLVSEEAKFTINGMSLGFQTFFSTLAVRTGKHVQLGNAFTDIQVESTRMPNHAVFDLITSYFKLNKKIDPKEKDDRPTEITN
jgi:hypothetical protein